MVISKHSSRIWLVRGLSGLGILIFSVIGVSLYLGAFYIAPKNKPVPPPPSYWLSQTIHFKNDQLVGWFVPIDASKPSQCVLLLHGLKSSRKGVIPIAQFLRDAGFSIFMFDFRGHGESKPDTVTFGLHESEDARAALSWLHEHAHCTHIGVWGHSMGGAAAILGPSPLPVDAFVLDSTYGSIEQATQHRIIHIMGHPLGDLVSPLLLAQIPWRLHASYAQLRPSEAIAHVHAPTLIIYGTRDQYVYLDEAQSMFKASGAKNKELWIVPGASHGKTHSIDPGRYAQKVVSFFKKNL